MEGLAIYVFLAVVGLAALLYLKKKGIRWKYQKYLWAMAGLGALCFLVGILEKVAAGQPETVQTLERNAAGAGASQVQLFLDAGMLLKEYSYSVTVEEQQLTEEESGQLFDAAIRELEVLVQGENPSLEEISTDLYLPEQLQSGVVSVLYYLDSYEVVDVDGTVRWENLTAENELLGITAEMSCQEKKAEYTFFIRLVPKELDERSALLQDIQSQLSSENEKQGQQYVQLPQESGGVSLVWKRSGEAMHMKVLLMGIALMVIQYVYAKEKQERVKKERNRQLIRDYPDIVSQLSLLTGAGMTVSAAWAKIAAEYSNQLECGAVNARAGYEELKRTWHEMQDGMGEIQAYGNFGERCGLSQYRKFSSILMQNVRKGTKGMQQLLDTEAEEAFRRRKSQARQLGEEAGTKLLIPMGIMLLLVFAILLLPAMMNMQI